MPAPAVIPAPRVYTKAVAVKTLVVEFQHPVSRAAEMAGACLHGCAFASRRSPEKRTTHTTVPGFHRGLSLGRGTRTTPTDKGGGKLGRIVYLEQTRVIQAGA